MKLNSLSADQKSDIVASSASFGVGQEHNLSLFFQQYAEFKDLSYKASCNKLNRWKQSLKPEQYTIKKVTTKPLSIKEKAYTNLVTSLKALIANEDKQKIGIYNIDLLRSMLQVEFSALNSSELFFKHCYGPSWANKFIAKNKLPATFSSTILTSFNKENKNKQLKTPDLTSTTPNTQTQLCLKGNSVVDKKTFVLEFSEASYINPESFRRSVLTIGSDFMDEYGVDIFVEHYNVSDLHCCIFKENDQSYYIQSLANIGSSICRFDQNKVISSKNLCKFDLCNEIMCRDRKCEHCVSAVEINDFICFFQVTQSDHVLIYNDLDSSVCLQLVLTSTCTSQQIDSSTTTIVPVVNHSVSATEKSFLPIVIIVSPTESDDILFNQSLPQPKWGTLKLTNQYVFNLYFKAQNIYSVGRAKTCDVRMPDINCVGLTHFKVFLAHSKNKPVNYVESFSGLATYVYSCSSNKTLLATLTFGERWFLESNMLLYTQAISNDNEEYGCIFLRTAHDIEAAIEMKSKSLAIIASKKRTIQQSEKTIVSKKYEDKFVGEELFKKHQCYGFSLSDEF